MVRIGIMWLRIGSTDKLVSYGSLQSIKGEIFLDFLSIYQFFKNNSIQWSYLRLINLKYTKTVTITSKLC
jgi:hypothetical protein